MNETKESILCVIVRFRSLSPYPLFLRSLSCPHVHYICIKVCIGRPFLYFVSYWKQSNSQSEVRHLTTSLTSSYSLSSFHTTSESHCQSHPNVFFCFVFFLLGKKFWLSQWLWVHLHGLRAAVLLPGWALHHNRLRQHGHQHRHRWPADRGWVNYWNIKKQYFWVVGLKVRWRVGSTCPLLRKGHFLSISYIIFWYFIIN